MSLARQLSALALALVAGGALAAAAPSRTSNIPVTTTLADLGTTGAPLRVQSDGRGAYTTVTVNRVKRVDSLLIVNPTGTDWSLTTYYNSKGALVASDRTVFFDLRELAAAGGFVTPILGTDAYGAAAEYGRATAHLTAKCSVVNVDMTKMALDATAQCPGSLRFRAPDGVWYRFSFQPDNYPNSERFLVTCTQVDGTGCKVWTLAPVSTRTTGGDPNPKSLNTLLQIDASGNILAVGGDYYLSFSITLAR